MLLRYSLTFLVDNREEKGTFGLGFPEDEEEIEDFDDFPEYDEIEVDAADADILSKFLPSAPREKRSLADIIMEKINEKNAAEGLPEIGKLAFCLFV